MIPRLQIVRQEHTTNGLIYELEKYQRKEKLPLKTALQWTEQFFAKTPNQSTSVQAHSKAWKCVYEKITKEKHNTKKKEKDKCIHQEHVAGFMAQQFVIPHLKLDSREQLSGALENPTVQKIMSSPSPVLAMAQYQGEMFGKYVKNTEVKLLERDKKLTHFSKKLQDVTTEKDHLHHEMMRLSAKNDVLIQKSEADKAYTEEKLAKQKQTYKN